jgi:hypothetical protein
MSQHPADPASSLGTGQAARRPDVAAIIHRAIDELLRDARRRASRAVADPAQPSQPGTAKRPA